jgi:hypothetical protein
MCDCSSWDAQASTYTLNTIRRTWLHMTTDHWLFLCYHEFKCCACCCLRWLPSADPWVNHRGLLSFACTSIASVSLRKQARSMVLCNTCFPNQYACKCSVTKDAIATHSAQCINNTTNSKASTHNSEHMITHGWSRCTCIYAFHMHVSACMYTLSMSLLQLFPLSCYIHLIELKALASTATIQNLSTDELSFNTRATYCLGMY